MFKKRCCKNVYIHFKVCALSQKKRDLDIKRRDSQIINRPLVEWNNLEPADLLFNHNNAWFCIVVVSGGGRQTRISSSYRGTLLC